MQFHHLVPKKKKKEKICLDSCTRSDYHLVYRNEAIFGGDLMEYVKPLTPGACEACDVS